MTPPIGLARHAEATRSERRESPLGEQIWRDAERFTHINLYNAKQSLDTHGESFTTAHTAELAYAMQSRHLRSADTDEWPTSQLVSNRIALITLELPTAARAQRALDSNGHRGQDRETQVATLSQFNKDVAGVLAYLPPSMIADFAERFVDQAESLLEQRLGLPVYDRKGFYTVMAGVMREVAVIRALDSNMPDGWHVEHATVEQDVHGTDLTVVTDKNERLAMDIKSQNSFYRKVMKLRDFGHLSHDEAEKALTSGYFYSDLKVQDDEAGAVCIVNADSLGEIRHFQYNDAEPVVHFVEARLAEKRVEKLRHLGKPAITTEPSRAPSDERRRGGLAYLERGQPRAFRR